MRAAIATLVGLVTFAVGIAVATLIAMSLPLDQDMRILFAILLGAPVGPLTFAAAVATWDRVDNR